ncbi:MAG: hypothetical protein IJZ55_04085 [Lachnospiraceae bacterium]|nr:hypothetical protein [Lachnospiraceae bacterium]
MKEKLTNNFWMKLLSVGIAIVFWFIIITSEDPVESKEFKDIPVQVLNEELVLEREKVLEILSGDTVDVVLEGRRSELERLTEKDIVANADLSEVSFMNTVMIRAEVPDYPGITVLNNGENQMKLLFDDYVTERFSFRVETIGEPMAGYYVGDALPSPNIIQISGAKTVLDKIKEVVLEVDVSGRSVDFATTALPKVYDMNGDEIAASKLTLQEEANTVAVNVPILTSKLLRVRVNTVGEPAEGYEILPENIAFQPEMVRVAGTKEELNELGYYLTLEVDVSELAGTLEKNFQVSSLLDKNLESLRVVDGQTVAVEVKVTPYVRKELEVPISKIELRNLGEEYEAKVLPTLDVKVSISCKKARESLITVENLKPYVDLAGFTEGTYMVPLQFDLPSKVLWEEEMGLDVVISKK